MKNELGIKIVKMISLDKWLLRFSKEQKIAKELNTLHSGVDNEKQLYREYLGTKVGYMFFGIICFTIILLIIWLMPNTESELSGNAILRNGYDGLEKSIFLVAKSEGMEEEIEVLVEPLHYSEAQLKTMSDEVFLYLSNQVFLKNGDIKDGLYVVNNHMEFPASVEGYPFSIVWESSDYNVLDSDGTIAKEVSKNGENVCITAKLSYYEHTYQREYLLQVFPAVKDWKESFLYEMEKTIEELDNSTSEEEALYLPEEIDGHRITYEEKTENTYGIIIFLGVIGMVFVWISMDNNVSKQLENRNNQLLADYAKLVSKLSLYLGTGLSFRTAVSKIVESSDKGRFYVKELEVVERELENGIAENRAVERLADRCRLPCYIKLSVLINQNIKKGNNSLQKQLKDEADKAFEERKNLARKYGEEAGTKLLFPMILMLLVVMVMIMYPAFVSFTI